MPLLPRTKPLIKELSLSGSGDVPYKLLESNSDCESIYMEAMGALAIDLYTASTAMLMTCLKIGLLDRYNYYEGKDYMDFYNLIWWAQHRLHDKIPDHVFVMLRNNILIGQPIGRELAYNILDWVNDILNLLYETGDIEVLDGVTSH